MSNIESTVWKNPIALEKSRWATDNYGTITLNLINKLDPKDNLSEYDVETLLKIISGIDNILELRKRYIVTNNGDQVGISDNNELFINQDKYYFTPYASGLYKIEDLLYIKGSNERALDMLRKELRKIKYKGPDIQRVESLKQTYWRSFDVAFILERPEAPGELYREKVNFHHKPIDEMNKIIKETAKSIKLRWKNRFDIKGRIYGAECWAKSVAENYEGLEFLHVNIPRYIKYNKDEETLHRMEAICVFQNIGGKLQSDKFRCSAHDYKTFKLLASRHKKNHDLLQKHGKAENAWQIETLLARAIIDKMPQYGKILLHEIEQTLIGKGVNPKHPIKRGISVFYMKDGELTARVKFGKKAKYSQNLIEIYNFVPPENLKIAMIENPVSRVIEHPYLEDLIIKNVRQRGNTFYIRPHKKLMPLKDVLDQLRSHVKAAGNPE